MLRSTILLVDAGVSLVLGVVLVVFPPPLVAWLGVPSAETAFYPSLLGAVVIGVAVALFLEWKRAPTGSVGLGTAGAIAVDLCAAFSLAGWLIFGSLDLPLRGRIVLWSVAAVLVFVSVVGLAAIRQRPR